MKISILYFSGTGNTEIIANLIATEFEKDQPADLFKIEDILLQKTGFDLTQSDLIGIGYPIYGFNPSRNVMRLVKTFPQSSQKKVFLFSTCAGPLYLNDIASYGLKRKLHRKGFSIIYEKQFYIPPNVAFRYPDEVVKQLYMAAQKKAGLMVFDMRSGIINVRRDGILPMLFRWLLLLIEKISWATVPSILE